MGTSTQHQLGHGTTAKHLERERESCKASLQWVQVTPCAHNSSVETSNIILKMQLILSKFSFALQVECLASQPRSS